MAKSKLLPMTRTLRWLNSLPGVYADSCESKRGTKSHDAFGFADIVAVGWRGHPAAFIQVTSASNQSSRRKNVLAAPLAERILATNLNVGVYLVYWYPPEDRGPKVERVRLCDGKLEVAEYPTTIEEWHP